MLRRADWQVKDPTGIFLNGLNWKMKGIRSVETSVTIYHIPEDLHLQPHRCQNSNLSKSRISLSLYQTYGSLSCSKELAIGPYPSARRTKFTSPYRVVVLQALLTSKMSVTFCLNSMYKPEVRLQCTRKIFGYLSNDLFPVSVKYSLNRPGGNVGYIWISIQSGVLISS
jgi:hypothetical protein